MAKKKTTRTKTTRRRRGGGDLTLTASAAALLKDLVRDLQQQVKDDAALQQQFKAEHQHSREAGRTGLAWSEWLATELEQVAASWLLSVVFVRFAEDTGLIKHPMLSGPPHDDPERNRLQQAIDAERRYIDRHREHDAAEYLAHVFRECAKLPGLGPLLAPVGEAIPGAGGGNGSATGHAPWSRAPLSTEAARALLDWTRARSEEDDARLQWDFRRLAALPEGFAPAKPDRAHIPSTRFLGDLYQDLSEPARKRFALLQTPDFVEAFILDRTLDPAIEAFPEAFEVDRLDGAIDDPGYFGIIDPTCGSGHFLLGAFERLLAHWGRIAPGLDQQERVRRALASVVGVDINPFAAAIARFRLLVAAVTACGVERLADAPNFTIRVETGDSLLFGTRWARGGAGAGHQRQLPYAQHDDTETDEQRLTSDDLIESVLSAENADELAAIFGRRYHAVVGNPPYIQPKDRRLNEIYRGLYDACSGKYALSVPFMERFVELAAEGDPRRGTPAGFVGKITANSFMKREFGKKLIEDFFSKWDLTHVIDTSGAYIPGHGTPTVILFLRNQRPATDTVRAVLGIRGEPSTPELPANGLVWRAIVEQVDQPGSEGEFVSAEDRERTMFASHPWSLGGGGAGELLERIEGVAKQRLGDAADSIGITSFTLEDDVFIRPAEAWARSSPTLNTRPMVEGDSLRDWTFSTKDFAAFHYDSDLVYHGDLTPPADTALWAWRATLQSNRLFGGKNKAEGGIGAYEFGRLTTDKLRTPLSIAFAFVATHNHFVLDRGGKVFNRSAPVIKLPEDATEDDHLALLAILNSSTACFWIKQVSFPKGGDHVGTEGARVRRTLWDDRYEFTGSNLEKFPLAGTDLASWASALGDVCIAAAGTRQIVNSEIKPDCSKSYEALRTATSLQEELDWHVYHAYGLTESPLALDDPDATPPIALGERAFEIVMARRMAAGELQTTWFERHRSTPITEIPSHWPEDYRRIVQARIDRIESDRDIALIERPEHKRRWNVEPFEDRLARALDTALLDHIEGLDLWRPAPTTPPEPVTVARLAEILETDEAFLRLLRLREEDDAPDVLAAVKRLVESEAVPFLPTLYLKPSGLAKRADWQHTWELQAKEDPFLDAQDTLLRDHFGAEPAEQQTARKFVAHWRVDMKERPNADPLRTEALFPRRRGEAAPTPDELTALRELKSKWVDLERDRRDAVGGGDTPPVPPRYTSSDFRHSTFWKHRGKLDVPKERFISYPGLSPEGDNTLLVGWAGWNQRQRAEALAILLNQHRAAGTDPARLLPLLQGLDDLVFWLHKWHAHEPEGNLGDAYRAFVDQQTHEMGVGVQEVRGWTPTERRGRTAAATTGD